MLRRPWTIVGAAMMLAAAPAGAAVAGGGRVGTARSGNHAARAPIQGGNGSCGASQPADPSLGFVWFKRSGDALWIRVQLRHGAAHAIYSLYLFDSSCNGVGGSGFIGKFTANRVGSGKFQAKVSVGVSESEFFADVRGKTHNATPYVTLAP